MLSFKDYIVEQDYIDWDYVFGFILEEEDEPDFKVDKNKYGEKHTHTFNVPKKSGKGSHQVRVSIERYGNEHHVNFHVDDSVEIARAKRIPGQQRMKIFRGVARAVTSYATKNVKPGHSIHAETADLDPDAEERKSITQSIFFDKLATRLGGRYHNYDGIAHEIKIPRKRKVVKAV